MLHQTALTANEINITICRCDDVYLTLQIMVSSPFATIHLYATLYHAE